jgi:proteasome lid subunit RPN8/RPN11
MEVTEIEITEHALETLFGEVRRAREEGGELAGSILAHERDGRALVAYVLPSGPRADRSWGHVRTDAALQNEMMERIARLRPELRYAGDWHIHPMPMPDLSGTDRRTAQAILLDDGAERSHLLLLLGTVTSALAPVVLGFVAHLSAPSTLHVGKVPITPVPGDSPGVIARLGHPLPPLAELLRADGDTAAQHPEDDDERFEDRVTARIIEDDLAAVRRDLAAEAELWRDEELFGAVIRRGGREALVVFPPEYPLGAPQVFAGTAREGPLTPIALRFGWSSLHRLSEPVADALREGADRRRSRRVIARRSRSLVQVLRSLLAWVGLHRIARTLAPERPEVIA